MSFLSEFFSLGTLSSCSLLVCTLTKVDVFMVVK